MHNIQTTTVEQNRKINDIFDKRRVFDLKDGCLSIEIDNLIVHCRYVDDDLYNREAYLITDFVHSAIEYLTLDLNGEHGVSLYNGEHSFVYIFEGFVYRIFFKILSQNGNLSHQRYLGAKLITGMYKPLEDK